MYVQPLDPSMAPSPLLQGIGNLDGALSLGLGSGGASAGDAIARFVQAPQSAALASAEPLDSQDGGSGDGSMDAMLAQLMQMMQTMMGALGLGGSSGYGGYPGYGSYPGYGGCNGSGCANGNEQYFSTANGGSKGDPHLSFNGSTWNSMNSQPDLLESNSIPGGYQVSTQVTAPNANGVTYNQSATIALNGGSTTISLNNQGQATIDQYGQNISISPGQSITLGNGESVTYTNGGALQVVTGNGSGGQISTTLSCDGPGVNVAVSAQNVDLGGSLVNGSNGTNPGPPVVTPPIPPPQPYYPPTPAPTPYPYQ